jgi:DNA-binding response OmpR family regulator
LSTIQEQELSAADQIRLAEGIRKDAEWLVRVTENLLSVTRVSTHNMIKKEDEVLEEIIGSAIMKYHRLPDSLPVDSDTLKDIILVPMDDSEEDKAVALDSGADDYITKPFGSIELLARIRTALRHSLTAAENKEIGIDGCYHVGELEIDYKKLRVCVRGKDVHLTPNEFRIIALLGKHPGRVMTYKSILRELWGPSAPMDNKILRVHMASIRRKIENDPTNPQYIFTEVGVGYRIAENTQEADDQY